LTRLKEADLRKQLECDDNWEQGISAGYQDTDRLLKEMEWLQGSNFLREYKLVSATPTLDDDLP
jgi:hypothetical protein